LLHFNGMNFPFGEHVVYTDCVPLLSWFLQLLPFTHNYLVAVLHLFLFGSFIVTPQIFFSICQRIQLNKWTSFCISLAIVLLSPQYLKLRSGHFALAIPWAIPLAILLLLRLFDDGRRKNVMILATYIFVTFFLHPYTGLGISVFSFIAILLFGIFKRDRRTIARYLSFSLTSGLLPVLCFSLFMLVTDSHGDRPTETMGQELQTSSVTALIKPTAGPLSVFVEKKLGLKEGHWEGFCYLGIFLIVYTMLFILVAPLLRKRLSWDSALIALFFSSLILLFVSFGWHIKIWQVAGLDLPGNLQQFRASGRFSWYFYYCLPLLLFGFLRRLPQSILIPFAVIYLFLNLWEAQYVFRADMRRFWTVRNIFNPDLLNPEEREVLTVIKKSQISFILPLPVFHEGTELFQRLGHTNSRIPALLYSYHSGLPILSTELSRTSIKETESAFNLLNVWKKDSLLQDHSERALVISTSDPMLPIETRAKKATSFFEQNDSIHFGILDPVRLRKSDLTEFTLIKKNHFKPPSSSFSYIPHQPTKPFVLSNFDEYNVICEWPAKYDDSLVVSLHFYWQKKSYRGFDCNLIVVESDSTESSWKYIVPLSLLSGYYPHFGVFEHVIKVSRSKKYSFMLKGSGKGQYRISDFMLRPIDMNLLIVNDRDTSFNNYPR
jgi:hypothetical protein